MSYKITDVERNGIKIRVEVENQSTKEKQNWYFTIWEYQSNARILERLTKELNKQEANKTKIENKMSNLNELIGEEL